MRDSKSFVYQHPEAESDDQTRFDKSLQELSDLRSQLHHAADYCEETFLNAKQKQIVIRNTKEYICQAVVTVVDHLGSVSANLDHQLSKTNSVLETELRIDCLKQKLATCQQYSHKLALRKVCWNADFLRYHPRYIISQPIFNLQRSNAVLRESGGPPAAKTIMIKQEFETQEEVPLFLYKYKPYLVEDSTIDNGVEKRNSSSTPVSPVQDGLVLQPKPQHHLFHFQEKRKLKRHMLNWKSMQNNDIISLIRWSTRTA